MAVPILCVQPVRTLIVKSRLFHRRSVQTIGGTRSFSTGFGFHFCARNGTSDDRIPAVMTAGRCCCASKFTSKPICSCCIAVCSRFRSRGDCDSCLSLRSSSRRIGPPEDWPTASIGVQNPDPDRLFMSDCCTTCGTIRMSGRISHCGLRTRLSSTNTENGFQRSV